MGERREAAFVEAAQRYAEAFERAAGLTPDKPLHDVTAARTAFEQAILGAGELGLARWIAASALALAAGPQGEEGRATFRTKDRACENCGRGLREHEQQRYCPTTDDDEDEDDGDEY